jgi:hypothetical protein
MSWWTHFRDLVQAGLPPHPSLPPSPLPFCPPSGSGREIVASYSGEKIYCFGTRQNAQVIVTSTNF